MSRFTDRMRAVGVPCGLKFNGEEISLHITDTFTRDVSVIVDLEEGQFAGDARAEFEGTILVAESDLDKFTTPDGNPVVLMTFNGQRYHIFGDPVAREGLWLFRIKRHEGERERSNAFDINDNQAGWRN